MKNLRPIRDVVYEYVYFTPLEKIAIEHPMCQRLRFILQNSTAYLTYPANQLTRFSHSLGVMHMGGEMFKNALLNASDIDQMDFVNVLEQYILSDLINEDAKKGPLRLHEFQTFWEDQGYTDIGMSFPYIKSVPQDLSTKASFLINFTWQSLRIACLLHDIGHLPFSHVFEMAIANFEMKFSKELKDINHNPISQMKIKLGDQLGLSTDAIEDKGASKIHELIGASIINSIFDSYKAPEQDESLALLKLCLDFANKIFSYDDTKKYNNQNDPHAVIPCLHTIISSEIDADRLDYVLRDSISSGLDVGNFDYKRILLHSKFRFTPKKQSSNSLSKIDRGIVEYLISDKALSSIEQFFNLRYTYYQHLIFHHNVSKYDSVLIKILELIFCRSILNREAIDEKLLSIVEGRDGFHLYTNGSLFDLKNMQVYDDAWLRVLLQKIHGLSVDDDLQGNYQYSLLFNLIDSFLYRNCKNIISYIKKPSDLDDGLRKYFDDNKGNFSELKAELSALNGNSPNGIIPVVNLQSGNSWDVSQLVRYLFSTSEYKAKYPWEQLILNLDLEFKEHNAILLYKITPAKFLKKTTKIWREKQQETVLITDLSTYLQSFQRISDFSFGLYFGVSAEGIKKDGNPSRETLEHILYKCILQQATSLLQVKRGTQTHS